MKAEFEQHTDALILSIAAGLATSALHECSERSAPTVPGSLPQRIGAPSLGPRGS